MDTKAVLPQYVHSGKNYEKAESKCLTSPRLFAAVALALGLVAIIGACAVAAVALLPTATGKHLENEQSMVSH